MRTCGKKSGKVVVMYRASQSDKKRFTITQRDLAEERMLSQQAHEILSSLRYKRWLIRQALEAGAAIEPGLRTVEIKQRRDLVIR